MKKMYGVCIDGEYWQEPNRVVAFDTMEKLVGYLVENCWIGKDWFTTDENGKSGTLIELYGNNWKGVVKKWNLERLRNELFNVILYEILCP